MTGLFTTKTRPRKKSAGLRHQGLYVFKRGWRVANALEFIQFLRNGYK